MKFDVVIIGGGLVGMGLALALRESALKVALVEPRPPTPIPATATDIDWDSRIYAISPGSAAFLESLGVWQMLDATRVTPVYEMAVFGAGYENESAAQLNFSAYDSGLPELAFIAENRQLQAAMWNALKQQKNVTIFCPAQCDSITWDEAHAKLHLADGKVLQAALIVGADGLDSWVREQAGIKVTQRPYQQIGVVANFSTEQSHRNIAHQWFRQDGVLALLPLPDKRVSMVWSANEEKAHALLALSAAELCQQVAAASCHSLGELQLVTQPAAFPLHFVRVKKLVQPRLALIGDAAHGIHPLAGQGVNLGLRDARELAATLIARGPQPDCGDYLLLRRYERARQEDILAMQLATDGLQKLFNNANPVLARLRNTGLGITNHLPQIKSQLMQHALA
ncbi:MAG: UbiH/UbiF family hydroxylase [Gallionella sp.]|nr:UbiH/UbiF family hydroxylase [Gallionella sp.]